MTTNNTCSMQLSCNCNCSGTCNINCGCMTGKKYGYILGYEKNTRLAKEGDSISFSQIISFFFADTKNFS